MKIISLNTLAGRFFNPLIEFIKSEAPTTDCFCFQEVLNSEVFEEHDGFRANLFVEIAKALPNYNAYFSLAQEEFGMSTKTPNINAGLATYIKKDYVVKKSGDFFICNYKNSFNYKDYETFPNSVHHIQINLNGKLLTICNLYGISMPGTKLDTPNRLNQTKKVLEFIKNEAGEKIIIGDFNLLPHTKSIISFEESGFNNLIKTFNITTTRGSLIRKLHPEYETSPGVWQEFADYALVTPGIAVSNFKVPDLPLSDHLPMIVEFSLN